MSNNNQEHTCVFGLSWGDEGKGKIVDLLCANFDIVVRFNGGANAGHTVCVGDEKYALHLLPTGVLHDKVTGVIGPGVVVDPIMLMQEIDGLSQRGIDVINKLKISDRAHLVLQYHKIEDHLSEKSAGDKGKIGTTARGIGPCYADKMKRKTAIRFSDLLHEENLFDRLREIVAGKKAAFTAQYGSDGDLDVETIIEDLKKTKQVLTDNICDTTSLLHNAMDDGKTILFEGANGILLDIDHGTYPFVTSSSTGPHGIGPGAGVPLSKITYLIGITKAYATRVGSGPFVSELKDDTGDRIRTAGNEFGTTTGRPRRCGWFDAVSCKNSVNFTGTTDIAMMHLDTLSGFDQVGLCVAYELDGQTMTTPPSHFSQLNRAKPVIEYVPGWHENLRSIRKFEDLPQTAKNYIERVEAAVGATISMIGVGPDRSQTLVRGRLQNVINVPEPTTV